MVGKSRVIGEFGFFLDVGGDLRRCVIGGGVSVGRCYWGEFWVLVIYFTFRNVYKYFLF